MMNPVQQPKILFISTFPPKKCGIASFTQDLVDAINPEITNFEISVCALDKKSNANAYKSPVSMVMDAYDLDSCIETAAVINKDRSIKLICIEHEFGLFGGEMGEYLLGFLALIEKPFIIRFHTVLPVTDQKRLKIVRTIAALADKVIVMTNYCARLLKEDYTLNVNKIAIIPHGTHEINTVGGNQLKSKYQLEGKQILTTFGLLSPNKGIEKGIMAMKKISAKFHDAVYIVLGQTHPNLLEQEGEKYREYLQDIIDRNGLQKNVKLVNGYVPIKKLTEYLALTDVYLFTSKDPLQAVSGTFLYAMSAGCPIISNSFVLAQEMLDENTGVILESSDENELAEKAINLLGNDKLRSDMGNNAFLRTRETTWKKVATRHVALFSRILESPLPARELSSHSISNY